MQEEWKPICGFEGFYEVSNLGKVRSLNFNHTKTTRVLSPWVNTKGYECVHLCKNGETHSFRVNRLVALAFLPNVDFKPFVDHIDTNRRNNCVDNLRWCTQSENQKNQLSQKRYGLSKSKPIIQMTTLGEIIRVWPSAFEAERNGFNRDLIRKVITGKAKAHKGFQWKYLSDYVKKQETT